MSIDIRVHRMQAEDVAQADSLRHLAGWNQTEAEWNRFLQLESHGCFVAQLDGRAVGKGGVGPVTRALSEGFMKRVEGVKQEARAATQ